MKPTPLETKLLDNFKPGTITKDGFLGDDTRHVHDIIKADLLTLSRLGVEVETIADRLQYFIDEGKKGLETKVDLGDFTVQISWIGDCYPARLASRGGSIKLSPRWSIKN